MSQRRPDWLTGYGLLSPAIAIMAAMMVAPLLAMVALIDIVVVLARRATCKPDA